MLFNSLPFLIFLPVVFILYWFVFNRSLRWQNALLLVASYFFYGWWSWKFLGLLALSTLLDYLYGFGVASEKPGRSKLFLWLSVINNLGILAVFKYYDFFATQFKEGLALLGLHVDPFLLNLALPIGISFYTFHGMSYVFDIYRKKQAPVKNVVDYAVFVSFFPLLVAGPIERAKHLLPQVQTRRIFNISQAIFGCRLILWGMFKKVVIADGLSGFVDRIFSGYNDFNSITLILVVIAFSIQIYCDFSGYSDIAIGVSRLFGYELLSNFRFPYFSRNIAEFWKRWHISLSSWFRDYLYIPLGGSRKSIWATILNTFIIFLVSGLWHGASWNYIVWGGFHALAFVPLIIMDRTKVYSSDVVAAKSSLPTVKEVLLMVNTFIIVSIGWIFFRAENLSIAVDFLLHLFKGVFLNPKALLQIPQGLSLLPLMIFLIVFDWRLRRDERNLIFFKSSKLNYLTYLVLTLMIIRSYMSIDESQSFIYFQF